MCGIIGRINLIKPFGDLPRLDLIKHRGPDDEGKEIIHGKTCLAVLGFRRLSILDLSSLGHQPMKSKDDNYFIVFNGEVYNFREIREELISLGHSFVSNSDSEVVLASYIQWGEKCVDRIIGMFAACAARACTRSPR